MKYTWIQREDTKSFITVGEYVFETDPETFVQLCRIYLGIGNIAMVYEHLRKAFCDFYGKMQTISGNLIKNLTKGYIERIMTERPKPGRGGLLPWETEEALYEGGGQDEGLYNL